jgi:hypothetical protein
MALGGDEMRRKSEAAKVEVLLYMSKTSKIYKNVFYYHIYGGYT